MFNLNIQDFGLLYDAVVSYDKKASEDQSLKKLVVFVTGVCGF